MTDLVKRLRKQTYRWGDELATEAADRISELEAELYEERAADRAARLTIVDDLNQLQRKYDALVRRLDNLCDEWELIESPLCIKAYQRCIHELRALLENDDE